MRPSILKLTYFSPRKKGKLLVFLSVILNSAINNTAFDLVTENEDDEVIPTIDCNYYNVDDFSSAKFSSAKTFSIFHFNIHSIERHIEEFRVALQMLDFNFDIICISESN